MGTRRGGREECGRAGRPAGGGVGRRAEGEGHGYVGDGCVAARREGRRGAGGGVGRGVKCFWVGADAGCGRDRARNGAGGVAEARTKRDGMGALERESAMLLYLV